MEKENWPGLMVLTRGFSVELPGIEPDCLPVIMLLNCSFVPSRSRSLPAVSFSGLDGVKTSLPRPSAIRSVHQ